MPLGQRKYVNNFRTTLSAAVTNSATTMYITSSTGLPTLTGSDYYYLTLGNGATTEIVKVTARSSLTLTVVRAQEGTSGVAWSNGTAVELRATAASFSALGGYAYTMPDDGTSGQVLSTNGSGVLSWTTAGLSGTMSGDISVGGYKFTSASNGNIVIQPNGTGAINLGGNATQPVELRFLEDSDNGTNYVGFKAPTTLSGNQVWELPAADGSANQVLATTGSGVLQFVSGSLSGVFQYFDSKTASSSSELVFTNIPDCAYMLFVLQDIIPATNATSLYMRTSSDNGSSYDSGASDYSWTLWGYTATPGTAPDGSNASSFIRTTLDIKNTGNATANGRIYLYNPAGTDYTYIEGDTVCRSSAGTPLLTRHMIGGARLSAADVDAVRFYMSSGNIASGKIIAYKLSKT